MLKTLKSIMLFVVELLNSKAVKKRVAANVSALLTDDQIVQDVIIGHDEGQVVIITITNKNLYVIGDTVLHVVSKDEIYELVHVSGKLSKLIELVTINDKVDSIFFKVFTKRSITKLEDWLK